MRPYQRACVALLCLCVPALAIPSAADARPLKRAMISEINDVRSQRGLPRLRYSPRLTRAAAAHSGDMAARTFFGHNSSDGTSFGNRVRRYSRARSKGETLAYVETSLRSKARVIVRMWMRSPPHRRVLLRPSFRRVGVAGRQGRIQGARITYVTANYATRR